MTNEDLQFVADALLALCESDQRAPFHNDRYLQSKMRRDAESSALRTALLLAPGSDPLWEDEWRAVLEHAALTPRQRDVLLLRLEGHTFEEIGASARRTKQSAQHVFSLALKKLAHAFRVYPYAGLSDVYRSETRRGIRRAFGTMGRSG